MKFKHLLKTTALTLLLIIAGKVGWGQTTYVWNATSGGAYNTAANWTPTRTTPATTDILTFSDGGTYTVTALPAAETIGQLIISSNTKITLQAAATAVLTIAGGTGTDLDVPSGCELNLMGTNFAITINLTAGATGSISGNITFGGASANTAHRLTATDASAITFNNGSVFTANTFFNGSAFGTAAGNANTIIFANGSTYVAKAGSNPFGVTAPASAVIFQTGSTYSLEASLTPSLSNRTYANFRVNYSGAAISPSGTAPCRIDNLTILSGSVGITTALPILISNDITISSGTTFNYSPATANTTGLIFCGSGIQNINNAGTLTLGANANVVVKQGSTLQLSSNIAVLGKFTVMGTLNTVDKVISGATGYCVSGNSSVNLTGVLATGTNGLTGIASLTGIEAGMLVTGDAAIPANTFVTSTATSPTNTVFFTNYPTQNVASANLVFTRVAGTIKSGHANGLNGSITLSGANAFDANSSFEFNGSAAQVTGVLLPASFKNLTINNSNGVTLSGSTTVNGTLTMNSGQLALGGNTLAYGASATLAYTGSSAQTTAGEIIATVPNITINNSNGVTLASTTNITGALTLTSGKLDIGANNLTVGSISGYDATKYVIESGTGFLKMNTAAGTVTYPIGTSTSYTPFVTTGNTAGNVLGANIKNSITNATLDNEKCVKLEWKGTDGTPGNNTGTITFQWNASDEGSSINHSNPFVFAVWDGSKYQTNIVTVNGSGPYTATVDAPATYPPYPVIIGNKAAFYADPPVLAADATNNDVDNNIDITFTDDASWRSAITAVKDGSTTLTLTTDYTIASGKITLIPSATNSLKTPGSRTITVIATGYADATVTQQINHGVISTSKSTISNTPAMGVNTTSHVTLTAKDQYENPISGYVFKYDVAITNTTITTTEQYTIDGTARTSNISDVDITTPTDASGVTTFDITVPATVDGDDGVSVQVQLNDGTTNLGSALSYFAPTAPTFSISATPSLTELNLNGATVNLTIQNETFAGSLDKTKYTLHNAPTGVSVSDVTKNSSTTATLTLAFDGTDFDVDVTNFNITIAGTELTFGNPLTSNDLTITAVNLATVTTNAAITTNGLTTATWGGNVTADGGATVTEKGICWNTTGTPTLSDSKTTEGSGIGAITGNMTSLSTATKYYVRAYATNYDGTNYGSEYNFTTFASASTFTASYPKSANITLTGFDVVVNVSAAGKVYFLKLASGATAPTSATVKSTGTEITVAAASTDYTATITGLTQYTTYDVYFVTENSDGVLMDTPVLLSVTTLNTPAPSFTATYPKSASITTSGFNVVVNTNAIGKVFFLRLASGAAAPTSATVKSTGTAINIAAASTDYSSAITGLTSGTTYDVYFVTENNNATVLMASPVKLSVTTLSITVISIHDIQYTTDASGDSPYINQTVTTSGIVTAIKYNASQVQQGFYLQNGSGAWNGVYIYTATPVVAVGDNVTVTGTMTEFNKTTEMTPVTSSNIVSSNNTLPAPVALTTLAANNESYEGVLIKVSGATCTGSPATGTFVVNDGSGDLTVYKSLFQTLALTTNSKYNVTGILVDYYTTSHLYELYPRSAADISDITGIDDNNLNSNLTIYPNPFSNEIRFEGSQSVKRVVITSITGQVLKNVEIGQVNYVNTQDLPRGMYLVTFMNSKGEKTTQKMVKQ
ncbi:MAG: T9SS type A sorting domain-containing protein [Bacteroidales bacterium]|nr:T9SS type A sorting domain-containing protein [Bacteroidales bacterium]